MTTGPAPATAGAWCFFLEVFVDTVDVIPAAQPFQSPLEEKPNISGPSTLPHVSPPDLVFFFPGGFPPLLVPANPAEEAGGQWVEARSGRRRFRCAPRTGASALFEANADEVASLLDRDQILVLALHAETGPVAQPPETSPKAGMRRRLLGSAAMGLAASFKPPHGRFHGDAVGSWGSDQRALAFRDQVQRTVAVALVSVALSAVNPAVRVCLRANPSMEGNEARGASSTGKALLPPNN